MGKVSAGHKGVKRKGNEGTIQWQLLSNQARSPSSCLVRKHSPTAYAIRDFLQRSVVAFERIELQSHVPFNRRVERLSRQALFGGRESS